MHGLAGSAESKTGRAEINNGGTDRGGRGEAEGADSTEGPLAWLANDAALLFLLGRFSLTLLSTFSTLVSEATVLIAGVKKLV